MKIAEARAAFEAAGFKNVGGTGVNFVDAKGRIYGVRTDYRAEVKPADVEAIIAIAKANQEKP